mgnify:CR=1 FL=1
MSETVATAGTTDRSSLLVRGGLGIALGMALNGILILGAGSLAYAEGVRALTLPPVLFLTAAGGVGAVLVYWVVTGYLSAGERTFVRVAAVALVLSFLPDIALLAMDPEVTVPAAVTLMVLHVIAAVAIVWALVYWQP